MKSAVSLVICILCYTSTYAQSGTIKGRVFDAETNSPLKNVNVTTGSNSYGTSTDSTGAYALKLPFGFYKVTFSYVGYAASTEEVNVFSKKTFHIKDVLLKPKAILTGEVDVSGERISLSPNRQVIKEKDLDVMPTLFSDVVRSVKILPGVTSNDELTSAYNVRGGNFDENLIYLNGFKIYRPFLINRGIEENMTLINEHMVSGIKFFNGAFPVNYDDKTASVLDIDYTDKFPDRLHGEINADLFNAGATLTDKTGKLNWAAGVRYAYPASFARTLQMKGQYFPSFTDFQFFGNYKITDGSSIQMFLLYANNKFDLIPSTWNGNFQLSFLDIRQISLEYSGEENYNYKTGLAGLRYTTALSGNTELKSSLSYYSTNESFKKNLLINSYYSENAYNPDINRVYLKTRHETGNNALRLDYINMKTELTYKSGEHYLQSGININLSHLNNVLNETADESGADSVLNPPYKVYNIQKLNLNSLALYSEDEISLSRTLRGYVGARLLKYYYNGQLLFSPRAAVHYSPDNLNTVSLSWGYYYQPPYFYELKDMSDSLPPLKAQRSIHYEADWENTFNGGMKFIAEVYYKRMTDLIPYYVDQLNLVYGNSNNSDGYAYGLDLQYEGELVEGMKTWIGYSYLNSMERTAGSSYHRSLLDQTHTIRVYLQDRVKNNKNFQSHVLFMFGSGFLYHPMQTVTDPITGEHTMAVDYNDTFTYPFYFRMDMGLTFKFSAGKSSDIILTADVYNMFNNYNIGSYSWYHVFGGASQPVPVANIYSPRFFNLGLEYIF